MSIIKARRLLLDAAKTLRASGVAPRGAFDSSVYRVRAVSKVVPDNVNWMDAVKDDVTVTP
jgi:hypothetical protein